MKSEIKGRRFWSPAEKLQAIARMGAAGQYFVVREKDLYSVHLLSITDPLFAFPCKIRLLL